MSMRIASVALLLGLSACGNNDDQLKRSTQADCDAIQIGMTLRQAETIITDVLPLPAVCQSGLKPIGDTSCGEPASVCVIRWEWLSSNDCGPQGGCAYVCEVRTADTAVTGQPTLDTPICARRFLTHQAYY